MTQFSIPVIEHHSPKPGLAILPRLPSFTINNRQLLIAMVRSTLTCNSGKASRKYLAAIAGPTMRFLLDWSATPDLRISSTFIKVVRDFSATTRIGELAQGISYAYWKWERGYSWISDFSPWAAGLVPRYRGTKAPDFVMWNPAINGLTVMESKGTCGSSHVRLMGGALQQCRAAFTHPAFSRGFGCVLTLDAGNPSGGGTLHVRDPEREGLLTDEMKHYVFRRSYASWFDLVGDERMAELCRQDNTGGSGEWIDSRKAIQIQQDLDNPLRAITSSALGYKPDRARFGLDPIVLAAIGSFEEFRRTDWQLWQSQLKLDPGEYSGELIRFPDGTSISES